MLEMLDYVYIIIIILSIFVIKELVECLFLKRTDVEEFDSCANLQSLISNTDFLQRLKIKEAELLFLADGVTLATNTILWDLPGGLNVKNTSITNQNHDNTSTIYVTDDGVPSIRLKKDSELGHIQKDAVGKISMINFDEYYGSSTLFDTADYKIIFDAHDTSR